MKTMKIYLLLLITVLPHFLSAQNSFVEGSVTYSVQIAGTDPKQAKQTASGTLQLMLKGNVVVKELTLSSGFKNTMIFNPVEKKAYSLRSVGKENFALQLDAAHLKKKQEKCSRLEVQEFESDIKTIANFKTEKAKLSCNNAPPVFVYYTKEWMINNESLFEDFPSFTYLPLSYDLKNDDGTLFHFELQKIEAGPMDNSRFQIPEGYKVISVEEYKSWQH